MKKCVTYFVLIIVLCTLLTGCGINGRESFDEFYLTNVTDAYYETIDDDLFERIILSGTPEDAEGKFLFDAQDEIEINFFGELKTMKYLQINYVNANNVVGPCYMYRGEEKAKEVGDSVIYRDVAYISAYTGKLWDEFKIVTENPIFDIWPNNDFSEEMLIDYVKRQFELEGVTIPSDYRAEIYTQVKNEEQKSTTDYYCFYVPKENEKISKIAVYYYRYIDDFKTSDYYAFKATPGRNVYFTVRLLFDQETFKEMETLPFDKEKSLEKFDSFVKNKLFKKNDTAENYSIHQMVLTKYNDKLAIEYIIEIQYYLDPSNEKPIRDAISIVQFLE